MTMQNQVRAGINLDGLPDKFPTHRHDAAFWEGLGRAVATFGFLEEILAKAIFAFTATRPYDEAEIRQACDAWLRKLEHTLADSLGKLIDDYERAVRDHPDATIENLDDLLSDLRQAKEMRNIFCHGSWRLPTEEGASVPFFVDREKRVFDTAINYDFLAKVQRHVAQLACDVINTVTDMGWQFPGAEGPGKAIWSDQS